MTNEMSEKGPTTRPNSHTFQRRPRPIEWLQVGINGTLAVIGIVAICIYGRQLTVMKGQLDQMSRQYPELQRSADAADSAAKTAKGSLDFTKTVEEPFLSLDSVMPSNFPDGNNPGFVLAFRNNGRSLAVNVTGNTTMTLLGIDLPLSKLVRLDPVGNFSLPDIPAGSAGNRWMYIPDGGAFQRHREEVKRGTARFIIRGFIRWENRDGKKFPDRKFCLVYNPNSNRPPNIGILDFCEEKQQKAN